MLPPLVHRSACSPRTHIGLSCARRCYLCSRACLDHVSTLSLLCIFSMCFSFFQSVRLNLLRLFHSPAFSWCFCLCSCFALGCLQDFFLLFCWTTFVGIILCGTVYDWTSKFHFNYCVALPASVLTFSRSI